MPTPAINVKEYDVGDSVRTTALFKVNGTLTDPSGITLRVKSPSGSITTLTYPTGISKNSTGSYSADIELTASGDWWYRWESTGTVRSARERRLSVRKTEF